jgi:ribosome-binding protein aMBF1 (putative translation factor)
MGIAVRRVLAKKLKKTAFRRAYDELAIEFAIAQMLIAARAKAGLTQAELAKRMGTTQSAVARLESGRRMPSIDSLESYAKATGCRLHIELVRAA